MGPLPQIRLPLPPDWRSPFVGKTIPEVVAFMRNVHICKSLEGELRQDGQVASDEEADDEVADDEIGSDTAIDIREGCIPMLAMVLEAEKEMIRERIRKNRAERLAGKVEGTTKEKAKRKHENDLENVQLIPTSNDMISLFLDGFEHERWDEYFRLWREHHHWIS